MGLMNAGNHERDPRTYQHYAKLDAQGNVVAIVEVADSAVQVGSDDEFTDEQKQVYVNVTNLHPHHLDGAKVDAKLVRDRDFTKARAALKAAVDAP
jgi:hypothetical protein